MDPYATACLTTLPIRSGPISIFLFAVLSSPPPIFTTTSVGLAKPAPLVPTSLRHRSVQIYARQNHVRHLGYLLPPVPHQACQNHVRYAPHTGSPAFSQSPRANAPERAGRGRGRGAYYRAKYGSGHGRGSRADPLALSSSSSQAMVPGGPRDWDRLHNDLAAIDGQQYGRSFSLCPSRSCVT